MSSDFPVYQPPRRSRTVLLIVAVVVAGGILIAILPEAVLQLAVDNWPVFLSPLVGWTLGSMVVRMMHRRLGRVIVSLDVENHMFRAVLVPEELFRYISQKGNNVVYHTPSGMPVYLARGIDLERGSIDYGWVHENDALVVMTREEAYLRWRDTLDRILEENLMLMHHPHTMGLEYARENLRRHLDDLATALGLDVSSPSEGDQHPVPEPVPDEEQVPEQMGGDSE